MRRTIDAKKGTFAEPQPLPGQAGYRQSESAVLDREAKEMEQRLKQLQERMQRQQAADAAAGISASSGSGRWKSARAEKGSIRAYGRDVQEKHKKRQAEIESRGGYAATSSSGKAQQMKRQQDDAISGDITGPASFKTKGSDATFVYIDAAAVAVIAAVAVSVRITILRLIVDLKCLTNCLFLTVLVSFLLSGSCMAGGGRLSVAICAEYVAVRWCLRGECDRRAGAAGHHAGGPRLHEHHRAGAP